MESTKKIGDHGDKKLREIARDIAARFDLDAEIVEAIYRSQFEYVRHRMEEARGDPYNAPNLRLPKLGRFIARKRMIPYIEENRRRSRKDQQEQAPASTKSEDT